VLHAIAVDLVAESGRVMQGDLKDGRLDLYELHRFPNRIVDVHGHRHWDVWYLYDQIKQGMRAFAAQPRTRNHSFGIDTWGVDFALLARDGSILGLPFSYRDDRTKGVMPKFLKLMPRQRVYELTGIQFLSINTLYQLYSMKLDKSPLLGVATDLLFMPDLFNYLLTGEKLTEFTFATTSQLYNPLTRSWASELFEVLGISAGLMQEVVGPGSVIGRLLPDVCDETGFPRCQVVATASHDTAAAVAAVPAEGDEWMYISSGTWSLVGVETTKPNMSPAAQRLNFTNEGGVGGTYRLLKNLSGMRMLQGLVCDGEEVPDYDGLTRAAAQAPEFRLFIDPGNWRFAGGRDADFAIGHYCMMTRQNVPFLHGHIARGILESLALKYRQVLGELRRVCARPIERIHIVGGGSRNRLLCQMTADATGLEVHAGPTEATAIGNIMVQAMGLGFVGSLEEIRRVVAASCEVEVYKPRNTKKWDKAYESFREVLGRRWRDAWAD